MTDTDRTPSADAPRQLSILSRLWNGFANSSIVQFFWEIISQIFSTLRAILVLLIQTPAVLLPSVAQTSSKDDEYNQELNKRLRALADELGLDSQQKKTIQDNWLGQIDWTNKRATRERNANELIRWWQIVLGVLIPVLVGMDSSEARTLASIAGIFVAVLTAIYQFRRPEERWQHYRAINERYLAEYWNFIVLSEDVYKDVPDHKAAFQRFNARMNEIKREEVSKFFSTVVAQQQGQPAQPAQPQGMQVQVTDFQGRQVEIQPASAGAAIAVMQPAASGDTSDAG